ncbi:MAG: hypothetical protein M0Q24_01445 [Sulfurimonas sp.]|uniref:hypothetical protein n=1 Tax=Sulfurimonas sp. TaxID=2022749 RepID=UPI0025F682FD|nr:hypothetical protein [Sulfurimonas sp.]MCK9490727.1 hypothetical protein [Sulfurimonas sp.]
MAKKKKIPKYILDSETSKEVRLSAKIPDSFDRHEPSWKFNLIDNDGPWGWSNIDTSERWDILSNKINFKENLNWAELKEKGSHNIEINKLTKKAQKRLVEIGCNDIDELFSLRISGKERIWGIRDRFALKIIWWDPEHEVCPSLKKHT